MDWMVDSPHSMKEIRNCRGVGRDGLFAWVEKRNLPAAKTGRL